MISKIVICVTARQATVGRWRMGRLASCATYSNNTEGHEDFRHFLLRHPNVPIHLIVDVVEEDFRLESMPHTYGHARQEMVERKLNQLYRNSEYRTAHFVGREMDKRRDDRFLFIALTNSEIMAPWMEPIEILQAPLAGVYLLPTVSESLVRSLKLKSPDLLLMTRQSAGLRQTYFAHQHLRISRLTSLSGMDERQIARLYSSETEKTRLYLISLRMIARDSHLHVALPATTDNVDEAFMAQLESTQGVSCEIITLNDVARRIGLDAELLKHHPDLLHMQVLARQGTRGNLAPAPQTRQYQVHKLRLGINLASTVCVAGASIIAAANIASEIGINHQIGEANSQTRQQERLYEDVSRNFPKTPLPGNDLKVAVELAQKLGELDHTPQRLMEVVSEAISAQPEIQLNRLRWKFTEDANAKDGEGKELSAPGNGVPPPPPSPSGLYEIGFADGEISNFTGDYRVALESVSRLAEKLKQNKSVEQVVVLQQPVNTSSQASLQGSTLDQQTQQLPAAQFKLKVILRPEVSGGAAK